MNSTYDSLFPKSMFCLVYNSASLFMKLLSDKIFPTFQKFSSLFKIMKFGTLVNSYLYSWKNIIKVSLCLLIVMELPTNR